MTSSFTAGPGSSPGSGPSSGPSGPNRTSANTPPRATESTPSPVTGSLTRTPGPPGPMMQAVRQPVYGLGMVVSVVVALVIFVLAIFIIGEADDDRLPLLQTTNLLFWIVAAITIMSAAIGAQYAERTAAEAAAAVGRSRPQTAMATAWSVPTVVTLAAVLLVATYHNGVMVVAGPLIAFLGNAGALLSRDLLDDASDNTQRTATTIHTLVIHAVAFLAFSAVYLNKMPTWAMAPLAGIIGSLLILETLERGEASVQQRLLYGAIGGLLIAEAAVALNWWQTYNWTGGAVLLVVFYLIAGILLARTQRSILRTRDLIEFGLVSTVAFVVLAVTA